MYCLVFQRNIAAGISTGAFYKGDVQRESRVEEVVCTVEVKKLYDFLTAFSGGSVYASAVNSGIHKGFHPYLSDNSWFV